MSHRNNPANPITLAGLTVILALVMAACGSSATPAPQPAEPAIDPEELRSVVEETVQKTIREAAPPAGDTISRHDLENLEQALGERIEDAVAAAVAEALAANPPSSRPGPGQATPAGSRPSPGEPPTGGQPSPEEPPGESQPTLDGGTGSATGGEEPVSGSNSGQPRPTPKPTIVFADLNWESATLQNRIAMFIVEHGFGYPVDSVSGDTETLWTKMLEGEVQVTMEVWLPNLEGKWNEAIAEGAIIPLGKSLDDNWQGFAVPSYVTFSRGGLVSVLDIPDFTGLFDTPDSNGKAVLVNCPVGSACHEINKGKIEAYKLQDFVELTTPISFDALAQSLEDASREQKPWLGYLWGPSRLAAQLNLTVLQEEPYSADCWATTRACAYPTSRVMVAVHPDLLSKAPDVADFLRKWRFSSRSQVDVESWMHTNDATAEEAAIRFLRSSWPTWNQWVPEEVFRRVQSALPPR